MAYHFKAAGLAGVAALCLMAAGASATTIELTYKGASSGGDAKKVNITAVPSLTPPAVSGNQWAFGFKMESDQPSPFDRFTAWCLDLQYYLGVVGAHRYEMTDTPFSSTLDLSLDGRGGRIQDVFDANYATVDISDGAQAAGFQLALWEALYDSDLNLMTGDFQAADKDVNATTAFDFAQGYLVAADGYGDGRKFTLTFLESTPVSGPKKQNLVTATPVPLPAAGLLLLAALGGLSALRRRRKTA